MDIFDTITKRHSYRGEFNGAEIPREKLKQIVQAGIQAPSGCNAQTTSFVIVDDKSLINEIAMIMEKPTITTAGAVIVTVMETRAVYQEMSFGVEDYSCAVENMLLAITALGYATVWIDGALRREQRAERIGSLLGIPDKLQVRVILPVGEPVEKVQQAKRLSFEQRAGFNRYI